VRTVTVDGTPSGSASGSVRPRSTSRWPPSTPPPASIVVYEAPNETSDGTALDLQPHRHGRRGPGRHHQLGLLRAGQQLGAASARRTPSSSAWPRRGRPWWPRRATRGPRTATSRPRQGRDRAGGRRPGQPARRPERGRHHDGRRRRGEPVGLEQLPGKRPRATASSTGATVPAAGVLVGLAQAGVAAGSAGRNARAVPDLSSMPIPPTAWRSTSPGTAAGRPSAGTSIVSPGDRRVPGRHQSGLQRHRRLVAPRSTPRTTPPNFTDVTTGQQRLHGDERGNYAATSGYDPATGLGTPEEQNLAIALQGADGCPSVAGLSADSGPVSGAGPITITGGGLADASKITFGAAGAGTIVSRRRRPSSSCRPHRGRPSAWTSP
jgi:hypothetical protein